LASLVAYTQELTEFRRMMRRLVREARYLAESA
jgi:hypothetical protein